MTITKSLRSSIAHAAAIDDDNLGSEDGLRIALIEANFSENENLVAADLTLGALENYDYRVGNAGPLSSAPEAGSPDIVIDIPPPAGGWRFLSGSTMTYPLDVYGYAILSADGTILYASKKFPAKITFSASGEEILLDAVKLRFPPAGIL